MRDEIKKRSVVILGHKTSVSLEAGFWLEAKRLAGLDGLTMSQFLTAIDRDRPGCSLSSSIRLTVVERMRAERDTLMATLRNRMTPAPKPGAAELALTRPAV